MITKKAEPEAPKDDGIVFDFGGMISKVEQVTKYIADAALWFDDEENHKAQRRKRGKFSARSDAVACDEDDSFSYVSHISCGSISCVSSIATPTVIDQRDYGGEMERHTSGHVRVEDEVDTTDQTTAAIILVPFVVEQRELLTIKVNSMANSNFAYIVDVPPTVTGCCKELRPGDVIAPYRLDSNERPTPFTLAEYADFVMSSKASPLRFVVLRSAAK